MESSQATQAVEFMRSTASGWRCAVCFLEGRLYQFRADGTTPLGEADRCPGCGETVCDRPNHELPHTMQRTDHHGVRSHAFAD